MPRERDAVPAELEKRLTKPSFGCPPNSASTSGEAADYLEGDLSQSNSAIHASPMPSLLLRGRPLLCLVRGSNPLVPIRFPFVWRHWFMDISRTVFPPLLDISGSVLSGTGLNVDLDAHLRSSFRFGLSHLRVLLFHSLKLAEQPGGF